MSEACTTTATRQTSSTARTARRRPEARRQSEKAASSQKLYPTPPLPKKLKQSHLPSHTTKKPYRSVPSPSLSVSRHPLRIQNKKSRMSCHDAFHGQGRGKSKKSTEMEKFRLRIQLLAVHCRIRHPIALPVSMPSTHPLRRDRGPRALMLYAVGRDACCAMMSAYSHRVSHVCAASKGGQGPATVLGTQPIACGADRRNRHTAFCKLLVVAHGAADGRDEQSRWAWMEELRARRSPFSDGEQVKREKTCIQPPTR